MDHPKEVVKVGDVVTLRILKIEDEDHRIGLELAARGSHLLMQTLTGNPLQPIST